MRSNLKFLLFFIFLVYLVSPSSKANATEVTFRLVDQFGATVQRSLFWVDPDIYPGDSAISLAPGSYPVASIPGMSDSTQNPALWKLYRWDTVTVSGVSQTIELEWRQAWYKLTLEDQLAGSIPSSSFLVDAAMSDIIILSGDSIFLPVTEDLTHNEPVGARAMGYPIWSLPGLLDSSNAFRLYRIEDPQELTVAGLVTTYVWPVQTISIAATDQFGSPYDSTSFGIVGFGNTQWRTPVVFSFPQTEDPSNPLPIAGTHKNGLALTLYPGFEGKVQGNMYRDEVLGEITSSGIDLDFEWKTAYLRLTMQDQNGDTIPKSQMVIISGFTPQSLSNGDSLLLPVSEDSDHPTITGANEDGYSVAIFPGLNGELQGGPLRRNEPPLELTSAGLLRVFTWRTAYLKTNVVDQNGSPIDSSIIVISGTGKNVDFRNGDSLLLPVTSDPLEIPVVGTWAGGYRAAIFPPINGVKQGNSVFRYDSTLALAEAGAEYNLEWPLARGKLMLVDVNEITIQEATIRRSGLFTALGCTDIALPITEGPQIGFAPTQSWVNFGYPFEIEPFSGAGFTIPDSFEVLEDFSVVPNFVDINGTMYGIRIDSDSDCVSTAIDNCPTVFNPDQEDFDFDGVGDSCDNCITTFNPAQIDVDSNGIGDACYLPPLIIVARDIPELGPGFLGRQEEDPMVNITVTDPDGLVIGADENGVITNTIGDGAEYNNVELNDSIVIDEPRVGTYTIKVVLEAGGIPGCCAAIIGIQGISREDTLAIIDLTETQDTTFTIEQDPYGAGDCDGNMRVNIADITKLISRIFAGGEACSPTAAGDADCNERVNIADVTYLINRIFAGGPAPGCH